MSRQRRKAVTAVSIGAMLIAVAILSAGFLAYAEFGPDRDIPISRLPEGISPFWDNESLNISAEDASFGLEEALSGTANALSFRFVPRTEVSDALPKATPLGPKAQPAPVKGGAYYLDPAGNDNADGTTPQTAWRTLERMNDDSYSGGDRILLKRGSTFVISKGLVIPFSGIQGKPVEISSYGSGQNPVIDGSGGPDTRIVVKGQYLTIRDLSIRNMRGSGLEVENTAVKALHGYRFENLVIENVGRHAVIFSEYQGVHDAIIKGCTIRNVGGTAVAIMGNRDDHSGNIEVAYNDIDGTRNDDSITIHEGDSNPANYVGSGISIHHNRIKNSGEDGIDLTTGSQVKVYQNVITGSENIGIMTDHSLNGAEIYENMIVDNGAASALVYISTPNTAFHRNLLSGTGSSRHVLYISDGNANPGVHATNIDVYGNTIVWNGESAGDAVYVVNDNGGLRDLNFKDNIVTTGINVMPRYAIAFGHSSFSATDPSFQSNGNIYGPGDVAFKSAGGELDLGQWKALGHDRDGLSAGPGFVDRLHGDFNLRPNSVAIDHAVSVLARSQTSDVLGNGVSGNTVDAGAFEYVK